MPSRLSANPDIARRQPIAVAGPDRPGCHVVELQRRRLLAATIVLYRRGGAQAATAQAATVASICNHAAVSRETFNRLFDDREDCVAAAFQDGVLRAGAAVGSAVRGKADWRSRTRAGLGAMLSFLDDNQALARFLFVYAPGEGPRLMAERANALSRLVALLADGAPTVRGRQSSPITAEGLVGAVTSVVYARLLGEEKPKPLLDLTGELMAVIVGPYLGPAAARREREAPADDGREAESRLSPQALGDPLENLPIRITYRTTRVLGSIAAAPGASSKQVARASGVADDGQMSRLLARLERHRLVSDTGGDPAKGEARAWRLTPRGHEILRVAGQS